MLNKLIDYSLRNRLIVLSITIIVVILGIFNLSDLEIDVFPDLTAPTVAVLTDAHGMASEEVERLITFPIETSLNGATDVRRVRSSSSGGLSIVWVEFDWGTEIYQARQVVTEKLATIANNLPEGTRAPILAPQTSLMGEIMLISVTTDSSNMMELRSISDRNIRQRLLAVSGVADIVTIGGEPKQYQVLADPIRMDRYNISIEELFEVCKNIGINTSGSFFNEYGQEYVVRGIGNINDPEDIARSVIKLNNGLPVRIDDIADVKLGTAPKVGDAFLNRKPAVLMAVLKQPNVNTLDLTESIDKALLGIQSNLPGGITINSHLFRQSDFIQRAVENVVIVLFEGGFFVLIILFIFLLNIRTTFISLITIPVSLLITTLALKLMGLTINTMSLGGMAIAIGVLVDDAIIDVENVLKRLRENRTRTGDERKGIISCVYLASVEIRSSIVHATLIIIVAFLPLFFLSGMEGRMLKPLGLTFIISLFSSMIVALTLTPVLSSFILSRDSFLISINNKKNPITSSIMKVYRILLEKALKRGKLILAISFAIFIGSVIVLLNLGRSFLPEFNEGTLTLTTITIPGVSLDESNKLADQIDRELLSITEIKNVSRRTGRAGLSEHSHGGSNSSEIDAPYTLNERSHDEFMAEVRSKLSKISGMSITIGQPLGHRIDHMLSGTKANIAIKVFGDDLSKLIGIANKIQGEIESTEGLVDLAVEQLVEVPQIQIRPNFEMLARYGIPLNSFTEFIDIALAGEKASELYEGNFAYPVIVKYNDEFRNSISNIRNTLIDNVENTKVPLQYVADIVSTTGPNTINRENVQRKIVVSANVAGRDLSGVVGEIQEKIAAGIKLPESYRIEYGGQFESEQRATFLIMISSILSIFLILVILYSEFRYVGLSLVILLNLPLALIGGIITIWIWSGMLNIPSIIGFITLFGIATRNGILLVSRYENLKTEGKDIKSIIMDGSMDRLNPILMTALASICALIPMVVSGSQPGNEIQSPMAAVILGGLFSSTFLNLFVTPIVYHLINRRKG